MKGKIGNGSEHIETQIKKEMMYSQFLNMNWLMLGNEGMYSSLIENGWSMNDRIGNCVFASFREETYWNVLEKREIIKFKRMYFNTLNINWQLIENAGMYCKNIGTWLNITEFIGNGWNIKNILAKYCIGAFRKIQNI